MKLKTLMLINAVAAGVFGLAFVFLPGWVAANYGIPADAGLRYVNQLFGANLVAVLVGSGRPGVGCPHGHQPCTLRHQRSGVRRDGRGATQPRYERRRLVLGRHLPVLHSWLGVLPPGEVGSLTAAAERVLSVLAVLA